MPRGREPPEPVKVGFTHLEGVLRRIHAEDSTVHLVSPSPVEGRAVIEVASPDGSRRTWYAFPAEDIERVAELLASLNIDAPDLRGGS